MDDRRQGRARVVVVGGGVAGSLLAKSIQFHADVVLIDPKEYFEIPWTNLRSRIDPHIAERSLINHSEYLVNGRIITSYAVAVTESEVTIAEGRKIMYDYLVIASGHLYPSPRTKKERFEQFQEDNLKIKSSRSVLVIGGGPTGVELAGEIAYDDPDKTVTLVHRGDRILEFMGNRASSKAHEWLKTRNVDVVLGQSIDLESVTRANRVFKTSHGETIEADAYFVCVNRPLSSSWLQNSHLKKHLDMYGRLMVDENLRVGGLSNVFAIGDITDIPERKQGFLAQRHAIVVAKNLKLLIKGAKEAKLAKYKPGVIVPMVSLGKREGVAQFPLMTVVGVLPGMLRSREFFLRKTRKQMGLDQNTSAFELPW